MTHEQIRINQTSRNTIRTKKPQASLAVDAVLESIQHALQNGEHVQLLGFGTFEVRERAAREGRNPQTGEALTIPAGKTPAFKAGKALKEAVNAT